MNVLVTLTAFNEAQNIGKIIRQIRELKYRCLVVDDGSIDSTAEIADALGAIVIKHCMNLGQGYAVLTSFKAAIQEDCEIVIEMDADGQHEPKEIKLFVDKLEKSKKYVHGNKKFSADLAKAQGADVMRQILMTHKAAKGDADTFYENAQEYFVPAPKK